MESGTSSAMRHGWLAEACLADLGEGAAVSISVLSSADRDRGAGRWCPSPRCNLDLSISTEAAALTFVAPKLATTRSSSTNKLATDTS